ncbi:MAG: tetratricopeptide repeat protein [Phycisphaeraceae bacterium]|nr:tetratricopeptide repeat protein [Phycisphaeraceae bacterium]
MVRFRSIAPVLILLLVGGAIYSNSFSGVMVFDDHQVLIDNSMIRHPLQIWLHPAGVQETGLSGRPVTAFTFALNYQIHGLKVWGYHLVNLVIHLAAALTLMGITRRTLDLPRFAGRYAASSRWLALTIALLWMAHPLQTSAVTYVSQRLEILMGLCYLLTLYCVIRSHDSSNSSQRKGWSVAALIVCAVGMGSKEVMVTAPLVVFIYDWIFLSGNFRELIRRRWRLHLSLTATWVILALLVCYSPRGQSVGFHFDDLTALDYLQTQTSSILTYLKLSLWPHPLILDYGPADFGVPILRHFTQYAPRGLIIVSLLIAVVLALRYRPAWGFPGVWFFLILAPSSSFLPMRTEVIAEHRMYLSLIAVIVLAVMAAYHVGERLFRSTSVDSAHASSGSTLPSMTAFILVAAAVSVLGALTYMRNWDYRSELVMWEDVVAKRPGNSRAFDAVGLEYSQINRLPEARTALLCALAIRPDFQYTQGLLGYVLMRQGDLDTAMMYLEKASLNQKPLDNRTTAAAWYQYGTLLQKKQQPRQALEAFERALRLDPDLAQAHNGAGVALTLLGNRSRAISEFEAALASRPGYDEARFNLAVSYGESGQTRQAIEHLRDILGRHPKHGLALANLAWAYATATDPAVRSPQSAIEFADLAEQQPSGKIALTYAARAKAYGELRRFNEAIRDAQQASKLASVADDPSLLNQLNSWLDAFRQGQVPADTQPALP